MLPFIKLSKLTCTMNGRAMAMGGGNRLCALYAWDERELERQFLSFHFLSLVNILVLVAGDSGHDGDDDDSSSSYGDGGSGGGG